MIGGGIVWQLHAAQSAGLLHTHIHHSHCGNYSDQCECSPNYLKGLCLSEYNRDREIDWEAVALCYLCGCFVAHCGGVILQVTGRFTLLHRESVKTRRYWWRDGGPSLTLLYQTLTQWINPKSSEIPLDWLRSDHLNHMSTQTHNLKFKQNVIVIWLTPPVCMHGYVATWQPTRFQLRADGK